MHKEFGRLIYKRSSLLLWIVGAIVLLPAGVSLAENTQIVRESADRGIRTLNDHSIYPSSNPSGAEAEEFNNICDLALEGDYLWAATAGGVVRWNTKNGSYVTYSTSDGLPSLPVKCIAIADNGIKYFGTDKGAAKFDGKDWTVYTADEGLAGNTVLCITIDQNGTICFGTDRGVTEFDGHSWKTYTTEDGLISNRIFSIAVDKNGNRWFGGIHGVSCFDGENWQTYPQDNFKKPPNSDTGPYAGPYLYEPTIQFTGPESVESIAIDQDGTLWLGSYWGTINSFDGNQWQVYEWGKPGYYGWWRQSWRGLGNVVNGIAVDSNNVKWLATGQGVLRYNGQSWKLYTDADGLLFPTLLPYSVPIGGIDAGSSFWVSSVAIAPDGTKYFGVPRGVSKFDGENWESYIVGKKSPIKQWQVTEAVGPLADSLRWKFKTDFPVFSPPAVSPDGTAYLTSSYPIYTYYLYAVSPKGKLKWKSKIEAIAWSSPAIGPDGSVYFGSGDNLYAISPTGELKWKFKTGQSVKSSPAIGSDGTVYFGSNDGLFYAISSEGKLKWKFETGGCVLSSPAISSDATVYFGSNDSYLYAVSPEGELKWRFDTGWCIWSSPAIDSNGTVYFGSADGYLYAVSPEGKLKWKFKTEDNVGSSPVLGLDGTVYFGSNDHYLYAVSPEGKLKWKFKTGNAIHSHLAIDSDGTVYFASDYLYALSPQGELRWKLRRGGSCLAFGLDGTLYFDSYGGHLYALDCSSQGPADSPWPMFGHDPRHTSRASEISTAVQVEGSTENVPNGFALFQNFPNPFNPNTQINYQIPEQTEVELTVYDILGRKVQTVVNETQQPGHYRIFWDGKDELDRDVSSGVYFYQLTVDLGKWTETKKMLLLR